MGLILSKALIINQMGYFLYVWNVRNRTTSRGTGRIVVHNSGHKSCLGAVWPSKWLLPYICQVGTRQHLKVQYYICLRRAK